MLGHYIGIGRQSGGVSFPATLTDGTCSFRQVIRGDYLCTDVTIAGSLLGFAGVENTDWECKESVNCSWLNNIDLQYSSRSGLSLLETKSGSNLNATIKPITGKMDATNFTDLASANFGKADSSGYIEVKAYYGGDNTKSLILWGIYDAAGVNYLLLYYLSGYIYFFIAKSGVGAFANVGRWQIDTGAGWYVVRITSTGSAYSLLVNGVSKPLSYTGGSDNGKWIDLIGATTRISSGALLKTTHEHSTMAGNISYVDYNNTNKWIFTGFGTKVFDVLGGLHMTWSGAAHAVFEGDANFCLSTGYSVWQKSGSADEYVPYSSANTPYDASAALVGYTKYRDYPGTLTGYNLYPSLIGFNEGNSADSRLEIFDRSNATRQTATSRAGVFYDATSLITKCRYYCAPTSSPFATEFSYETLKTFFNTDYKRLVFPKNNTPLVTALTEINVLDTNVSSDAQLRVILDYCNIESFIAFGDSITVGPSVTTRYSYLVANNRAVNEVNKGVASDAVQIELIARVSALSVYAENSKIFILCGINDIDHEVNHTGSQAAFITAYESIIDSLVSYGYGLNNIYISTLTFEDGDTWGYRALIVPYNVLIANIATNKGVNLIDLYSVTLNHSEYYTVDELHPNALGHTAMANQIISDINW